MQELFDQLSWDLPEPRYHRVKLFPLDETLLAQPTAKVGTPQRVKGNGAAAQQATMQLGVPAGVIAPPKGPTSGAFSLLQWEKAGSGNGNRAAENGNWARGAGSVEFDELATIPLMVLRSISLQQASPQPVMRSEISEAAGNAAYVSAGNIGGSVLKYGSNVLIQRAFGAGGFGLYTLGMSVVSLITAIFNLGLDDAMVRYISIYRARRKVASSRGLVIFCTTLAGISGILGALFMMFAAPYLAAVKHSPELAPILLMMAPMVPLLCMQTIWLSGLQGLKEFKWRVLIQRIMMPVALIVLLLGAIVFFHNLTSIVIATVVYGLISALLSFYFLFLKMAGMEQPGPETYEVRDWVGFAAPNFLTSIVDTVLLSIDTLMLTFFAISIVAIGQYGAAIKISSFIVMPLISFNTMFAPMIAELHSQGQHQKLTAMFHIVTKWSITFSLPIFWITTLFAVPLLSISGPQFTAAWPLVIAFSIGSMINVGTGPVGYILLMTGHTRLSFLNSLTAVIVDVILGVLLIPRYGVMGVAIATGVAVSVVNLMRLLQVRFLVKMQPYRWDVLKPLGAGLISALLTGELLYLLSQAHLSLQIFRFHVSFELTLVPVFLVSYTGLLVLFKTSPEDKIVLDMLRKKLKRGKRNKK